MIAMTRRPALRLTDEGFDEGILHEYNSVEPEFQENLSSTASFTEVSENMTNGIYERFDLSLIVGAVAITSCRFEASSIAFLALIIGETPTFMLLSSAATNERGSMSPQISVRAPDSAAFSIYSIQETERRLHPRSSRNITGMRSPLLKNGLSCSPLIRSSYRRDKRMCSYSLD